MEARWDDRVGTDNLTALRGSLRRLAGKLPSDLPDFMPLLGYGLTTRAPRAAGADTVDVGELPFFALLARPLVAFADEFEAVSTVSLAIGANLLRVFDTPGLQKRDLPRLTGVAKETIAVGVGWLDKAGLAKGTTLTSSGFAARDAALNRIRKVEAAWRLRYGAETISGLRSILEPLVGDGTVGGSPLFFGLAPPRSGWRASVPVPATLPQFPMVTHRGGYPDGS